MTDTDDGALGEGPDPGAPCDTPAGRGERFLDYSSDPSIPGPRPGLYPPPPASQVHPKPDGQPDQDDGSPDRPRHSGTRRRAGPTLAQRQLMTRIAAGRKARQQRVMLLALSALSALVLLVAGGSWVLTSYISGSLGRLDAGTAGTPSSGPLNILVAGVDVRTGLTRHQQLALHVGRAVSTNSDTLMVVHVPADHQSLQVVSLPRDSWVFIPGHGMNKINSAFGLGGPRLMVRTVEQDTGLTINDYVEVNFLGFVKVIDALGGVNICLPYAVNDPYSGLRMSAGRHHVGGIAALKFARDRHSFALSDLARIGNQQQLLSSLLRQAISTGTLANPVKLTRFLSSATSAIKVDQGLNVGRLANELRGIRPADVMFTTVPLGNMNYLTPNGQSAVLWNASAARSLFTRLKHDQPAAKAPPRRGHPRHPRLRRDQVSVDIYNGTLIGGLSAQTGSELASLHFRVHGSGLTWHAQNVTQTVIDYPAGQKAAALLIRHVMPGAVLHQARGLRRLRIVLGQNGYQITAPASATSGSAPGSAKTAAQDACK